MMATTHALAGLLVGSLAVFVAPDLAPAATIAGFAGGLFPDLDLYGAHRKTLHFPVYYGVVAVPALAVALLVPSSVTVGLAVFLLAAGFHSATDVFGGGLELRPWEGTSERAVYSHYHRRWLRPRRWIGYDGAPGDLAIASLLALPPLLLAEAELLTALVALTVAVSAAYTAVRKRLADLAEGIAPVVPPRVRPYVPERYL